MEIRSIYFTLYSKKKCKNMQAMGPEVAFLWHEVESRLGMEANARALDGDLTGFYRRILLEM